MSSQNLNLYAASIGMSAFTAYAVQTGLGALQEKAVRLEDTWEEYYEALRALEQAVDDQALKEEAFIRGVVYAGLMRDAGREQEFDEETVTEEIKRTLRLGQPARRSANLGAVERLRELAAVLQAGLITDEEYQTKRAEIVASI
jgi:hypothetical protein